MFWGGEIIIVTLVSFVLLQPLNLHHVSGGVQSGFPPAGRSEFRRSHRAALLGMVVIPFLDQGALSGELPVKVYTSRVACMTTSPHCVQLRVALIIEALGLVLMPFPVGIHAHGPDLAMQANFRLFFG